MKKLFLVSVFYLFLFGGVTGASTVFAAVGDTCGSSNEGLCVDVTGGTPGAGCPAGQEQVVGVGSACLTGDPSIRHICCKSTAVAPGGACGTGNAGTCVAPDPTTGVCSDTQDPVSGDPVCEAGYACCKQKPSTTPQCALPNSCELVGSCSGTPVSGECPSGQTCCAPAAGGTCSNSAGQTGTCSDANSCSNQISGAAGCTNPQVCCATSSGGTCSNSAGQTGTCSDANSCSNQISGATGCTNPQVCCGSGGGGTPGGGANIGFQNPLGYDNINDFLVSVLAWMRSVIVTLALVFLVVGALLYITSRGSEGQVTAAKLAMTAAAIGLAIGIAAPTFLREIAEILNLTSDEVKTDAIDGAPTLLEILLNVLNFLLGIVGTLAVIMFVVGGIMYFFAAGDQSRVDTGKKIVTYSAIGIAIALGGLVIVRQIASFFVGS